MLLTKHVIKTSSDRKGMWHTNNRCSALWPMSWNVFLASCSRIRLQKISPITAQSGRWKVSGDSGTINGHQEQHLIILCPSISYWITNDAVSRTPHKDTTERLASWVFPFWWMLQKCCERLQTMISRGAKCDLRAGKGCGNNRPIIVCTGTPSHILYQYMFGQWMMQLAVMCRCCTNIPSKKTF